MTAHPTTLPEFTAQVAALLPGWHHKVAPDNNQWCTTIINGKGAGLFLRYDRYTFDGSSRLSIAGSYPVHNGHYYGPLNVKRPEITCAIKRGPAAVAKDIARRLIPKYLPLYEQAAKSAADSRAYETQGLDSLEQMATALGVTIPTHNGSRRRLYLTGSPSGDIETLGTSVHLELRSVPLDLALYIARSIRKYKIEKGQ